MITPGSENRKQIASRLIELESRRPGLVRIRMNPGFAPLLAKALKEKGFKKRLLQSPQQFVVDCGLSYHEALYAILEISLLSGPNSGNGEFHCWYGNGEYAGWQGLFQLSDFSQLANNRIFVVIDISSFLSEINDLLDPAR